MWSGEVWCRRLLRLKTIPCTIWLASGRMIASNVEFELDVPIVDFYNSNNDVCSSAGRDQSGGQREWTTLDRLRTRQLPPSLKPNDLAVTSYIVLTPLNIPSSFDNLLMLYSLRLSRCDDLTSIT